MRPTRLHILLIDEGEFTGMVFLRQLHNLGYVLARRVASPAEWTGENGELLDVLLLAATGNPKQDAQTMAFFQQQYPGLKTLYLSLDAIAHFPGAHAVCGQDAEALDRLGIVMRKLLRPAQVSRQQE